MSFLLRQSPPVLCACGERAARILGHIPSDTTAASLLALGSWHLPETGGALYVHVCDGLLAYMCVGCAARRPASSAR